MAENTGITKVENSSHQETPAEETNNHFKNVASEMSEARAYGAEYQPQPLYNEASFQHFQNTATDAVQQTTSQSTLLPPQCNYPPNYYVSYDPSQYLSSPDYPVDWNAYNAQQYYPDNYFYYPNPYAGNEGGDADSKTFEQSFNNLNVNQYSDNNQMIDYSRFYQNPKQFSPGANKWDPKRMADQSRSTSSRYWSNGKSEGAGQSQLTLQYNPHDFTHNLDAAKFFVIKSYSEEDIFRSIKYNVWCSTEYGNKRLDSAFKSKIDTSSIYLFYSVNGSGHFCGVAAMTSPVDFENSPKVWTQSKWKGQFSVKWLYVKDVPNNQLRHIRLENNENKPVTNSRDTQEVPADKGRQVIHILHQYKHITSIFDDFPHYEQRLQDDQ